jgi:hypothetical protein
MRAWLPSPQATITKPHGALSGSAASHDTKSIYGLYAFHLTLQLAYGDYNDKFQRK